MAHDSIAPAAVAALLVAAGRLGVFGLPPVIAKAPDLCPDLATDHPTVTTSLFGPEGMHQVVDYHGCFLQNDHSTAPRLGGLRAFEAAIDSVAGSKRWIRPNRFR